MNYYTTLLTLTALLPTAHAMAQELTVLDQGSAWEIEATSFQYQGQDEDYQSCSNESFSDEMSVRETCSTSSVASPDVRDWVDNAWAVGGINSELSTNDYELDLTLYVSAANGPEGYTRASASLYSNVIFTLSHPAEVHLAMGLVYYTQDSETHWPGWHEPSSLFHLDSMSQIPLAEIAEQNLELPAGTYLLKSEQHMNAGPGLYESNGIQHTFELSVVWFDAPEIQADFNRDGRIDGEDLAKLLGAWGSNMADHDLNNDGIVDGKDLAILMGAWS